MIIAADVIKSDVCSINFLSLFLYIVSKVLIMIHKANDCLICLSSPASPVTSLLFVPKSSVMWPSDYQAEGSVFIVLPCWRVPNNVI